MHGRHRYHANGWHPGSGSGWKIRRESLLLLGAQARGGVGHLDAESSCPLKNADTVTRADVVCNLSSEALVVHQQQVDLSDVVDNELLEAVGEQVTGLLVRTVTNLGHGGLALEATPDPVIDTLGLPPCLLHTMVAIRLVALELGGALLDDGDLDGHWGLSGEMECEQG